MGQLIIRNANVTVTNVCVTTDGHGEGGSTAVQLTGAARNALIEHSTIRGADSARRSVEIAASNFGAPGAVLGHDYLHNCGECVHDQPWVIKDSYVIADGMRGTGDHLEPIYVNDGTLVAQHDTLLLPPNSSPQVAVVFANVNDGNGGACRNHITVTDSLLAGGGHPIEMCAKRELGRSSTMNIADNHFARCTSRPIVFNRGSGGTACAGYRGDPETLGRAGGDTHGYWPQGGYNGHVVGAYCPPTAGQTWTGNVWDDNGGRVRCR